ncbi:MAG: hypothetical protein MK479_09140, partial [Planctomycetes bacterium]|nr:hypothetical protein [Planctomycetota bacterium]
MFSKLKQVKSGRSIFSSRIGGVREDIRGRGDRRLLGTVCAQNPVISPSIFPLLNTNHGKHQVA